MRKPTGVVPQLGPIHSPWHRRGEAAARGPWGCPARCRSRRSAPMGVGKSLRAMACPDEASSGACASARPGSLASAADPRRVRSFVLCRGRTRPVRGTRGVVGPCRTKQAAAFSEGSSTTRHGIGGKGNAPRCGAWHPTPWLRPQTGVRPTDAGEKSSTARPGSAVSRPQKLVFLVLASSLALPGLLLGLSLRLIPGGRPAAVGVGLIWLLLR